MKVFTGEFYELMYKALHSEDMKLVGYIHEIVDVHFKALECVEKLKEAMGEGGQ